MSFERTGTTVRTVKSMMMMVRGESCLVLLIDDGNCLDQNHNIEQISKKK